MININNNYFLDRKENNIILNNENGENFAPDMAYILSSIANSYQPSQNLVLSIGEIRSLNKAVDILEENINNSDAVMEMEDEHFLVIKRVILDLLPRINVPIVLRNSPQIEDFLEELTPQSTFKKSSNIIG